jgi:two-component system, NtrC family, sensor histidine kinase KinB
VRLRRRLLLAQAPLLAALVLVAVMGAIGASRLGESADLILRDNYRSVLAAQRMKEAIERLDSAALFVVAGRRQEADPLIPPNRERFENELRVEEANLTEPGELQASQALRARWQEYQAAYEQLLGQAAPASELYFTELAPRFNAVKERAEAILDINQDAMVRKNERTRREARSWLAILVGVALIASGAAWLASSAMNARLARPVAVLGQAARRIGEGDMKARAQLVGATELEQLATDFNAMAEKLEQYRRSSLGDLLAAQHAAQAAIDSLPDAVVILDLPGRVVNANEAATTLLGIDTEVGATELMGVDPALREAIERARQHVIGGKGAYAPRGLEEAVRVSGERAFLPRATPVYADEGGVAGVAVVLQDVSRLLRFDQLKNDLVATVAHELRTPLTSLRMAIHLCAEEVVGPLTPKQGDLLFAAREDCARLQNIVDELLDLSRIQSGKVELQKQNVAPLELVDVALSAHRPAARERHIELRREVAPDLAPLFADAERLQIVFANLITNALRHTPEGGQVIVRAFSGEHAVRFEVVDSGPGVPAEQQARVFEKFARGDGPAGGAGLGLFIAKEIVVAHGGVIGVDSEIGKGATFWFEVAA